MGPSPGQPGRTKGVSKVQESLLEHPTKDSRKEERRKALVPRRRTVNPASTEVDAYIFIKENLRALGWDTAKPREGTVRSGVDPE